MHDNEGRGEGWGGRVRESKELAFVCFNDYTAGMWDMNTWISKGARLPRICERHVTFLVFKSVDQRETFIGHKDLPSRFKHGS